MPKLKLTYFDSTRARRALALSMGGIPFEDDRVSLSDWEGRKPNTPFGSLPHGSAGAVHLKPCSI
jgi:glutathione S-transferase